VLRAVTSDKLRCRWCRRAARAPQAPARATGLGVLGGRIARTAGWRSVGRAGAGGACAARGHHRHRRLSGVTARSTRHAGAASVVRRQMAGCRTARATGLHSVVRASAGGARAHEPARWRRMDTLARNTRHAGAVSVARLHGTHRGCRL